MAKKTTSNRKADASDSEAPQQPPLTKSAKEAVARFTECVKAKVKALLSPQRSQKKPAPAPITRPTSPPAQSAIRNEAEPFPKPQRSARSTPSSRPLTSEDGRSQPATTPYTKDDIALRAYFLAEQRRASGNSGNPDRDWIEAERQLAAENENLSRS